MKRDKRRAKTKIVIRGGEKRPRISVFRSNKYLYVQAIDDIRGHTIAAVEKAKDALVAGKNIAQKLLDKKIKEAVFDRAGYRYHGKIKQLADAAREAGLKF